MRSSRLWLVGRWSGMGSVGSYAREKASRLRRDFVRRHWRLLAGWAVGFIAVSCLVAWSQHGAVRWLYIGVAAASLFWSTLWMVDHLDGGRSWRDGVVGEELTAQALSGLERSDWRAFHGLVFQTTHRFDVDHTVIGPGGVFAVETKLANGVWTPSRSRWLGGSAVQAIRGADRIEKLLGRRVPKGSVRPLVVVWGESDGQSLPETVQGVAIMHAANSQTG